MSERSAETRQAMRTAAGRPEFIVDVSVPKLMPLLGLSTVGLAYGLTQDFDEAVTVVPVAAVFLALWLWLVLTAYPLLIVDDRGIAIRGISLAWDEIDSIEVYEALRLPVLLFHADPETLTERDPAAWRRWLRKRNPRARGLLGTPLMFMNCRRQRVLDVVEERSGMAIYGGERNP